MIVQNISTGGTGRTDVSFTLPSADGPNAVAALRKIQETVGFAELLYDDHVGKLSLVGAGMRSHPGVSATFFAALAEAGVNVEMISTSEIRISVVFRDTDLDTAVRAVHDAFESGTEADEAVVYGGRTMRSAVNTRPQRTAAWCGGRAMTALRRGRGRHRAGRCRHAADPAPNGRSRSPTSGTSPRPGRPAGRCPGRASTSGSRTPPLADPQGPGHRAVLRRGRYVA